MTILPEAKKLDLSVSIPFQCFENGIDGVDRESDDVLKVKLGKKAKMYITDAQNRFKYQYFELEEEDVAGKIIKSVPSCLKVPKYADKLFEGPYIENVDAAVAKYIFEKIIGYSNYFSAPVIIIRDRNGDVVDIVKYRPSREGYENLPKYLQEKSVNKPNGRGESFLYPFQIEMERLIKKEGFVFVGEGLKNSVNALIRSIPYISIESTSNVRNQALLNYVKELFRKGVVVYGAMDGDAAGEKAFNAMKDQMAFSIDNLLDFDSGLDFTDYIRKERI